MALVADPTSSFKVGKLLVKSKIALISISGVYGGDDFLFLILSIIQVELDVPALNIQGSKIDMKYFNYEKSIP